MCQLSKVDGPVGRVPQGCMAGVHALLRVESGVAEAEAASDGNRLSTTDYGSLRRRWRRTCRVQVWGSREILVPPLPHRTALSISAAGAVYMPTEKHKIKRRKYRGMGNGGKENFTLVHREHKRRMLSAHTATPCTHRREPPTERASSTGCRQLPSVVPPAAGIAYPK